MARVSLISPPYQSKSTIVDGQECVNIYAEIATGPIAANPQAPAQIVNQLFAGTRYYSSTDYQNKIRGVYRTSRDTAYVVIGPRVYFMAFDGSLSFVGNIADRPSQVYMSDNGIVVVIVDGAEGWAVNIADNAFGQIVDASFYGSDYVVFLDTFFVFNRPGTNQFYISLSNVDFAMLTGGTGFDPLDIAAKSGFNDNIVGLVTVHRELWLIGELTTEVWIGTGAADFYFQQVQGAYINHGCAARYSIAKTDILTFFITQDTEGSGIIVQGSGYELKEISTPRIVNIIKGYADFTDAIGFCMQVDDQPFYILIFVSANKGWAYNIKSGFWNEWNWLNVEDGSLNRPRANCAMFAYGKNIVGDFENGVLHEVTVDVKTDSVTASISGPITRIRTFPHSVGDKFQKVTYLEFIANMETGNQDQEEIEDDDDDSEDDSEDEIFLSWSNDRGKTYGNAVAQTMGTTGETLTSISWNRLGEARDRVFKLQWSSTRETSLLGAFVEAKAART